MGQITQLGVTEPKFKSNLFYSIALLIMPLHCHHHPPVFCEGRLRPKGHLLVLDWPILRLLSVVTLATLAQDSAFLKSKVVGLGREDADTAVREVEALGDCLLNLK